MAEAGIDQVAATLDAQVAEAVQLRFVQDSLPDFVTVMDAMTHLRQVRQRLDRLEEILGRVIRLRAAIGRIKMTTTAATEDAWNVAVARVRAQPVHRGGDMIGPREVYASADLAIIDQRRAARAVDDVASHADEAVEVVRLAYRGLDGARQDLLATIRALQYESSLER